MKFHTTLLLSALLVVTAQADTIIDSSKHNGGFVSATTGFNGSPDGWIASSGVWLASGNSGLTTAPFGADTATDSRYIQIHNDSGETLTSAAMFTVAAAETVNLSFDYKTGGTGADTTLTVSLWDAQANATYATLGTISTSTAQASFTQVDYSLSAPAANTRLQLRFTLSAGGKDMHIDRVHLDGGVLTPPPTIDYATSHFINPTDTEAIKVEKAAKTLPRQKQVDWQRLENTFFIHFGPNTFTGSEWGNGFEDPADFNPTALDAAQWVTTIKNAGGKMLMLVVKHHEGFCLYPSRYTTHDVASSPWLGGNGDLVRAVSDACAAQGIKFGVYLSPADLYQIESPLSYTNGSGYYGNGSSSQTSTIPTDPATFNSNPSQGRTPPTGFTTYSYDVDDYNRYFLNQLYELLTEYGDIAEMWFDGANPKPGTGQTYSRAAWYDLINTLQPNTNIAIDGPDVRWVGNETGYARETEWSVIPTPVSNLTTGGAPDLGSRSKLVGGKTLTWWPAEADTKILNGWFWKSSHGVKTASQLIDIYYASVGRNANLLLNLSPDTRGLIPDNQITPLMEAMTIIQQTYATNLASGGTMAADSTLAGQPASNCLDGDLDSYWEPEAGVSTPTLTLTLPSAQTIDRVVLQEAIAVRSMRIENFAVDTWNGTSWEEKATATTVGHKRILKITETSTDKVRIRITQSRLEPTLANVALYKSVSLLVSPLIANRDAQGKVSISASGGDSIYYTDDGSEPTTASKLYTAPIDLPMGGTIKAISENAGSVSLATVKTFSGYAPIGWQVISVSSEEIAEGERASNAIDDDPDTLWHTQWGGGGGSHPHQVTIDMQTSRLIGGFSYLPRVSGENGIVKNYRFEVSVDNVNWTNVAEAEFGNIKNSPVLQKVFFADDVKARYFRFTAIDEINGTNYASAAEINVLPGGYDKFRQENGLQTAPGNQDGDGDGLGLLMEYYLGTDPAVRSYSPVSISAVSGNPHFEVLRSTAATDVTAVVRYSYNLIDWFDATPTEVITVDQGEGVTKDTYILAPENQNVFYRLRVSI
ncbi:MAG: alpha-L-fucosidase [Akkermansiaceae bacterium]|nr:alpha-L-fucosidase [Akkermansiaceae bacterium]